jgi:protein-tyrosine phosphatase
MISVRPDKLWIGNARDARNVSLLHEHEINAVIDLAIEEAPAELPRELIYLRFPLLDGAGNEGVLLHSAIECIATLFSNVQLKVLVACSAGRSRSPALTAAAMAHVDGISLEDSICHLQNIAAFDISPALWIEILATSSR